MDLELKRIAVELSVPPKREFSRPLRVDPWPENGLPFDVAATPEERRALGHRLGLETLDRFEGTGRLSRADAGELLAEGLLRAEVVQTCVVTLEPVATRIEAPVRLRFSRSAGRDDAPLDPEGDDVLPLDGPVVDVGEVLVEELALRLDPYPRAPGAALEALEAAPGGPDPEPDGWAAGLAAHRQALAR